MYRGDKRRKEYDCIYIFIYAYDDVDVVGDDDDGGGGGGGGGGGNEFLLIKA